MMTRQSLLLQAVSLALLIFCRCKWFLRGSYRAGAVDDRQG